MWFFLLEIFIFLYLFGCARSQLQQAGSFSCSRWDLDPWPGIELRPPALGVQSLSHCTTNEVPLCAFIISFSFEDRLLSSEASLVAQTVKNLPAVWETQV